MSVKPTPYWEHREKDFECLKDHSISSKAFLSKRFSDRYCFRVTRLNDTSYNLVASYFIGVDWVIENHTAISVFPKIDSRINEVIESADNELYISKSDNKELLDIDLISVDYFKMLQHCFEDYEVSNETGDLFNINWHAPEITIERDEDFLTPLLVVKFLNILKKIVQKGLRKSYYKIDENLTSRIKGKILVSNNIKQNLVKNKLTKTVCRFDEFGINSFENRLLKKALLFCRSYIDHHKNLFQGNSSYLQLINYCSAAFELVSDDVSVNEIRNSRFNPFFKEYQSGLEIAKILLKKFSYSISKTSTKEITTPPYWIDMSKLFELYAFCFLKKIFKKPGELIYHYSTYGNELDFLINSVDTKMVVDAKYKPLYSIGQVHQDMRQVAGYARLNKVYDKLGVTEEKVIDCLIVYPDMQNGNTINDNDTFSKKQEIKSYNKMYKLGIRLPEKKIVNPK